MKKCWSSNPWWNKWPRIAFMTSSITLNWWVGQHAVSNSVQNLGDDVNKSRTGLLYHVREFLTNILSAVTLEWKALKCKPSVHYACTAPLIDGLGYEYAFTRGLHASWSRRVWHGLELHYKIACRCGSRYRRTHRPSTVNLCACAQRVKYNSWRRIWIKWCHTFIFSLWWSLYTSQRQIWPLWEPVATPFLSSERQMHMILCEGGRLPQKTSGTFIWIKDMARQGG